MTIKGGAGGLGNLSAIFQAFYDVTEETAVKKL